MDEIGFTSAFNLVDALESISIIYNTRQLSRVELERIKAITTNFTNFISTQSCENKDARDKLSQTIKYYQEKLSLFIDKILQDPNLTDNYKDTISYLLKVNNELCMKIADTRIIARQTLGGDS